MELDTKTYWLTDRQSQCNFDFDFDLKRACELGEKGRSKIAELRRPQTEEGQNRQKS
jgi:hypothetical protein